MIVLVEESVVEGAQEWEPVIEVGKITYKIEILVKNNMYLSY